MATQLSRSDGDDEISIYRASRSEHVTVSQYCPERPYVELRVPKDVATVDYIIFTTVSHDQGQLATLLKSLCAK